MRRASRWSGIVVGIAAVGLFACASPRTRARTAAAGAPLRVAVPQDTPPYAFRRDTQLVGLEVDFARKLAAALDRPLQLDEVPWEDILNVLGTGRDDVVMAGLTITPAREVRIAFSDPYLRSGLMAVVRREDVARYRTADSALDTTGGVGVVGGTTAERFVREHAPRAEIRPYRTAPAAMLELTQRRVAAVVHDAPVCVWFGSQDEADLAPILKLLDEEQLGWGMRRTDDELRTAVNGVLAKWRTDGTRDRILARWLPYWQRLETAPAPR